MQSVCAGNPDDSPLAHQIKKAHGMTEQWQTDLQIHGPERDDVLQKVWHQIHEWNLVMPNVEPLVIHFGLHDFRNTGLTEFWIANEQQAGYCGKFLFVFDDQTCPAHRHETKHETFFVVKGEVQMQTDEDRIMRAGDRLVMPPGVEHSFTGRGNALLLEVSMPSTLEDNFFDNRSIGRDGMI
jgi:D-lyxose ketol-isomerase